MSRCIAIGAGDVALALAEETDPAVQAWWVTRADRAEEIADERAALAVGRIVGG